MSRPIFTLILGAAAVAALPGTSGSSLRADVTLPAIFSNHMVLQADQEVAVWGWAEPGEEVTVALDGQEAKATAGDDKKWHVKLPAHKAGGPHVMTAKGNNTLTVQDVLYGEVWLGSGQSNMAMTVSRCKDFKAETATADLPLIRTFKEESGPATEPKENAKGSWVVCSPVTVGTFSGTAYFFGKEVHRVLKTPVGLINSSVGGTPVEAWTSWDAQKDKPELAPLFERWDEKAKTYDPAVAEKEYEAALAKWKELAIAARVTGKATAPAPKKPVHPTLDTHHPAVLFNAKIAPLVPYTIRGVLWYQGENNAASVQPENYGLQLRTLIEDWRTRWGVADLPFAWVQLPNYRIQVDTPVQTTGWVIVREEMRKTLSLPNTGMAVTLDVGDAKDIHPTNKQDVGMRLAMWALGTIYHRKGPQACGPLYESHQVDGGKVTIRFRYAADGMQVPNGLVKGFAIAGADRQWHRAEAKIEGDHIVVQSGAVPAPEAVRYAWGENPVANLFGMNGLPASPFRTDDWPLVEEVVKGKK